ncbi:MAG: hypothetical protein WD114_02515 [Phycisphaerales bacterium]
MLIAYVSCAVLPEPDLDERPLVMGLEAAGYGVEVVAWDDGTVDWSRFDAAVIRATWNYPEHEQAFREWIELAAGATRLFNSAEVVRWNMHKGYLRELEGRGVPIIPTVFFERGGKAELDAVCDGRGWEKIVIKPSIGCGSRGTGVFTLGDRRSQARAYLKDALGARDMMVQGYMPQVEREGETALVVIDGKLTHAIEKRPRFHGEDESVSLREGGPSDEQRAFARQVLDAAGRECLYARVDVIPDDDGGLMLSELEMLEPSLFFPQNPAAVGVLVRGLERRLASAQSGVG